MPCERSEIAIDTSAIRAGEEPCGWVIHYKYNFEGYAKWEFAIDNKLFPDLESAVQYAMTASSFLNPTVKALRLYTPGT
jgi:hypothetical protein